MTKEQELFKKQSLAWIAQHKNSIESCDLSIKHAKEQIKLCQKAIKLETEERKWKKKLLSDFVRQYKKFLTVIILAFMIGSCSKPSIDKPYCWECDVTYRIYKDTVNVCNETEAVPKFEDAERVRCKRIN